MLTISVPCSRSRMRAAPVSTIESMAIDEMTSEARSRGANAVIGVDLDYESLGSNGSMLMVAVSGTAVRLG